MLEKLLIFDYNTYYPKIISFFCKNNDKMNFSSCFYCDIHPIGKYFKDENEPRLTVDLDHFYPKSIYSLFGLSLYNFIPSCPLCNRNMKNAHNKRMLYPFTNGFDQNVHFKFAMNDSSDLDTLLGNNEDFDLLIENNENGLSKLEVDNTIKVFHLEEIYQSHKNVVSDYIKKNRVKNTPYFQDVMEQLNIAESEQLSLLYGADYDDFNNRPLSKLLADIMHQKEF